MLQALRKVQNFDDHFRDEEHIRTAVAAYYGLCSFVDHNVGQILKALDGQGLAGDTRVVYLSDHGDNLGKRGFWNKSAMYEESTGIPLIMAGPDVPAGHVVNDVVSLVDAYPTLIEATGETLTPEERQAAWRFLASDRERRGARAHRALRVPCRGLDHRHLP